MDEQSISLTVNDTKLIAKAEPRMSLADFLRERLGLTGTHIGCEHGVCGACTVICDGMAVRSCLMFAVQAEKKEIQTIEGLADGDTMHPLQALFSEQRALQCGFCTPGMIISAISLVKENKNPTEHEIRKHIEGNFCRCTGYENIVKSISDGASKMYEKENN